jgi:hypothetical protein
LVVGGWKRSFAPSNPTTKIPSISCVHKVAVGELVAWLGGEAGPQPSNQFSDSYLVST